MSAAQDKARAANLKRASNIMFAHLHQAILVAHEGGMGVTEIAEACGLSGMGVHKIIARLRQARHETPSSGLDLKRIAAAALAVDEAYRELTGHPNPTRKGNPLRGGSVERLRETRKATTAKRKAAVRSGEREPSSHGIAGYAQGCRCEECGAARSAYDRDRWASKPKERNL